MAKFADQWEPNGPFGIVTDSNMSGGYRVVTNDADKSDITILPPERQKVGMLVYVTATNKTWRLTTVGVRSPGTETYSVNPVFTEATVAVGADVSGGTANGVLYIDSTGKLAQDSTNFSYVASSRTATVGELVLNGDTAAITRVNLGALSIGNSDKVSSILIGTADNEDVVEIGRLGGPDTAIKSKLAMSGNIVPTFDDGYSLGDASFKWSNVYTNLVYAGQVRRQPGIVGADVGQSTTRFRKLWFQEGDFSGGLTAFGPISFGSTLTVDGAIRVNGSIGRSGPGILNIGTEANTDGINIGTTLSTGGVSIGQSGQDVTINGVLNANAGIGRSTDGALNIGNDANVTGGISIGTASATGGVTLGRNTQNATIIGSLITLNTASQDTRIDLANDSVGDKEIFVGSDKGGLKVGFNGNGPGGALVYSYINMYGANSVLPFLQQLTNTDAVLGSRKVVSGWYRIRATVVYKSLPGGDTSAVVATIDTSVTEGMASGCYYSFDDTEVGELLDNTTFTITGASISATGKAKISLEAVVKLTGSPIISFKAKTNVSGATLYALPGSGMEIIGVESPYVP